MADADQVDADEECIQHQQQPQSPENVKDAECHVAGKPEEEAFDAHARVHFRTDVPGDHPDHLQAQFQAGTASAASLFRSITAPPQRVAREW
jgi:hypothetical protein